jgi:trk system potassium uptake protein
MGEMKNGKGANNIKQGWRNAFRPTPAKILAGGFLFLILSGSLLLTLPVSARNGHPTAYLDALFTATSAVCVTGLVVLDTATHWSLFGQVILLLLIQIGALGIMSVVTLFAGLSGRSLGLTERMAIRDSISELGMKDIVVTFRAILLATIGIELVGVLAVAPVLVPRYGWGPGLWKSLFHAVSAFCNAGFDLFGTEAVPYQSLTGFSGDVQLILATSVLIILGGLGFLVWSECVRVRRFRKMSLHAKVVLVVTGLLLAIGTGLVLLTESAHALSGLPIGQKLLHSFFHAVSCRTAGFNTFALETLSDAGVFVSLLLMFIGAAPGSTGGGIKLTTVFVLWMAVSGFVRGRKELFVFRRRLPPQVVVRALTVLLLGFAVVGTSSFLLMTTGAGDLRQSLFESVSAYGTVGLGIGITATMSGFGKSLLIAVMFLGRIGAVTLLMVFSDRRETANASFRYPEEGMPVG